MRHAVNWFEIPAADLDRARAFYERVLDVRLIPVDIGDGLSMALFPTDGGGVGGALCRHPEFYVPSADGALVYLNADPDLQAAIDRVEDAGGRVVLPKRQISEEHGYMAVFVDSEGNRVALHSNG